MIVVKFTADYVEEFKDFGLWCGYCLCACEIIGVFDLPNPNLDSGSIQWTRPFSVQIQIRKSSFDADSLP